LLQTNHCATSVRVANHTLEGSCRSESLYRQAFVPTARPKYWQRRSGLDYRDNNQQKTMTLDADEFIRRFLLHTLPDGFQRISLLRSSWHRYWQQNLAQCRQLLGMVAPESTIPKDYRDRYEELTGCSLRRCPFVSTVA